MSLHWEYKVCKDHLRANVTGLWTQGSASELFVDVRRMSEETGMKKVYLNCWDMMPPTNDYVRYESGVEMARVWNSDLKVLAVWRSRFITRFLENVARNRGVDVLVTDNEEEGMSWLMKP